MINTSFNGKDDLLTILESGNAIDSPLNLTYKGRKAQR